MPDGAAKPFALYEYNPSSVAAILFIALFSLTTIAHGIQLVNRRVWYFLPFLLGGILEVVGFVGRLLSSRQSPNWTTPPYIMQSLCLLLAPSFLAASVYMVLGRIILLLDAERHCLIYVQGLAKVFVVGDVVSFLAQSAGGGQLAMAKTQSAINMGERMILIGLFVQLYFLAFFLTLAGVFFRGISRFPTPSSKSLNVPWKQHLINLLVVSSLIIVRSLYRFVEYIQGHDGSIAKTEVVLYVLDAGLMFLAMVLFNVWHPGNIIGPRSSTAKGKEPMSYNRLQEA